MLSTRKIKRSNMLSKRKRESKRDSEFWRKHILPLLDEKALLNFSATSKEARKLAYAELFKRADFADRINFKIHLFSRRAVDIGFQAKVREAEFVAENFNISQCITFGFSLILAILALLTRSDHSKVSDRLPLQESSSDFVVQSILMAAASLFLHLIYRFVKREIAGIHQHKNMNGEK